MAGQSRIITEPMRRVLQALAESPAAMTPFEVGRAVWGPGSVGLRRQMAGSVLRALERRRLAERARVESNTGEPAFIWRATLEGRHVLRDQPEVTAS